jgi:TPP-dependent pyruvate/acetoin dehydrogenase alpha subunit
MRMHGHSVNDGAEYVPKKLLDDWKKKDPLLKIEKQLVDRKILSQSIKSDYERKISAEIQEAIQVAIESPYPPAENAVTGVFAD